MKLHRELPAAMRQVSNVLSAAGLLTGFIVAISILSGDNEGRVNLLYLLLLFALLPIVGLFLSLLFLLRQNGRGLAGWLLELPIWPSRLRRDLLALGSARSHKYWLFYQTQLLALAFGIGGLLALLLLLLGSDISFVWRSTILDASNLMPLLQALAWPWQFWVEAQPRLDLLQQSQDFRLSNPEFTAELLGQWWRYTLAAQCTYNLIPRALMLVVAGHLYRRSGRSELVTDAASSIHRNPVNEVPELGDLAPLVRTVEDQFALVEWGNIPADVLDSLQQVLGKAGQVLPAGPLAEVNRELQQQDLDTVVVVKAWEPPMGELRDYLKQFATDRALPRKLLPLDFSGAALQSVSDVNLLEWRRFCGTLDNWSVLSLSAGDTA